MIAMSVIPTEADLDFNGDELFDKKIIAKSELLWSQKPHIVCRAPKEFIKIYKSQLYGKIVKNGRILNEIYAENAAGKVLLYEYIFSFISKSEVSIKTYKRQTAAYTMAHLSYLVSKSGKLLDFIKICHDQSVLKELNPIINATSLVIYKYITKTKEEIGDRSAWHKEEDCWNSVKALHLDIKIPDSLLVEDQ